jgi:hypothetical protein
LFDNIAAEVGMIQNLGGSILLTSDFNARTNAADVYVDCHYFAEHMLDTLPLGNDFPEVLPKRHNSDKGGLKGWHNEFLDLCSFSGLFILNGRITGDESRECTCLTNGGSSLVDYMVASPVLFDSATSLVVHKCLLFCGKGGDSNHRPLSLNLQLPWQHVSPTISDSWADIRRFKYDASKCTRYCQHLQQQIAQCTTQMSDINNVDMAVQLLHDYICNAARAVHGCLAARTNTTQHRHQPWFDTKCCSKHKEISAYAKLHPNSHLARKWKKQLKQLLRRKKCTYKKLQGRQLCALAKIDPASFWRQYSKTKERSVAISKTNLVAGF